MEKFQENLVRFCENEEGLWRKFGIYYVTCDSQAVRDSETVRKFYSVFMHKIDRARALEEFRETLRTSY
jgi:hypothetical protein